MNINYHYFTIKTLALAAKFSETDAQKIAHYSQLVDDFDLRGINSSILVSNRPPEYFFNHNYAKEITIPGHGIFYQFVSVITAINLILPVFTQYQQETLLPFHFIPQFSGWQQEQDKDRTKLRCVRASDCAPDSLILQWKKEAAKKAPDLIHLGLFLHTYADTYAHHGFSGLRGWENSSFIGNTACHMSDINKYKYYIVPSIGHANVGNLPDAGADRFDYIRAISSADKKYEEKIYRDNPSDYKRCSRDIFNLLCSLNGQTEWNDGDWDPFYQRIEEINRKILKDDNETEDVSELTKLWKKAFEKERYQYSYDSREGIKSAYFEESSEKQLVTKEAAAGEDNRVYAYELSDDIYQFNQYAYEHIRRVKGQNAVSRCKALPGQD